jgi:hypothetical protein
MELVARPVHLVTTSVAATAARAGAAAWGAARGAVAELVEAFVAGASGATAAVPEVAEFPLPPAAASETWLPVGATVSSGGSKEMNSIRKKLRS